MNSAARPLVAVVDDESRVLESLEDLLESDGYAARIFPSAKAFLESGALSSIGCLISDIRMADIDGWELESIVHRQRPDLPVIFISGHDGQPPSGPYLTRGGARRLFKKPFNGQDLLAAVRAALSAP
jgi:FixJ family two-component response regulator